MVTASRNRREDFDGRVGSGCRIGRHGRVALEQRAIPDRCGGPLRILLAVFVLLLLGGPAVASAQSAIISGRITNEQTSRPVTTAFVAALDNEGREVGTAITNSEGRYRILVPGGRYDLAVSGIGYGTRVLRTLEVSPGESVSADFEIAWQPIDLGSVTVTVGRVPERVIGAPAHVEVISGEVVRGRPVTTPVDHLRAVPGVDVITQGVQSTNVVVRGFNNIFSGALHTLTDHRIAGVPSLRVNVMNFVPAVDDDLERIEVVLGPGAALYGPNTANGVLHMMTRSPLGESRTSVTVMGGEQRLFGGTFRASRPLGASFGVKLSGQYLQADEWEFADPSELAERVKFQPESELFDQFRRDLMRAAGITQAEADLRIGRIAQRDFGIQRWAGELRADWAISDAATAIFTTGLSNAASQIELTGLGAGQAEDWRYSFYQARLNWNRLFAQVYLNQSHTEDTFLLRNGAPIVDRSRLWVAQVQHQAQLGLSQRFTYGIDLLYTDPDTDGTINGMYEDEDDTREIGVYVQSETRLSSTLNLVLAGRVDDHTALPSQVFSPRAGLVFQPSEAQAFRLTFNRAFSTPSSLNQFLDLGTAMPASFADASLLGYSVRVQGTGTQGFRFRQEGGSYLMRSPFTPDGIGGPAQLIPVEGAAGYWAAAVQVLAAQGFLPPPIRDYMLSLQPTPFDIGAGYAYAPGPGVGLPIGSLDLRDVTPIREEIQTTFELGYKGLVAERMLLATDVWYSRRTNLVTPLLVQTPFVTLNTPDVQAYLVPLLMNQGLPGPMAQAVAIGMGSVPVGVISSADVNANGAQLLSTFTNVDEEIDLWGVDVSGTFLLDDRWSLTAGASFVSDDSFIVPSLPRVVTLNAPKSKGSLAVRYQDRARALSGEIRARYSSSFPAASGVYEGTACLGGSLISTDPCVEAFTLVDVNLSLPIPGFAGTSVQFAVQNLLDTAYRSFPGVPEVGRMALIRLRHDF